MEILKYIVLAVYAIVCIGLIVLTTIQQVMIKEFLGQ